MNSEPGNITCRTLAQIGGGAPWRLGLLHDVPQHMFIWMTKGQGRAILQGVRCGVGVHNALFLPARTLFALDPGPQGFGQVLLMPADLIPPLPDTPQHLRIRDAQSQAECTALLDAVQREERMDRTYLQDALAGHIGLLSVWLRRQMGSDAHQPAHRSAAEVLAARFATLIVQNFQTGQPVANYAERLGVTPTHLTRACRTACGKTAAEMLAERVVWEAQERLGRDTTPVQDIASDLGFSSAAYFTRYIQHHTGATPSTLRRRARRHA